MGGCPEASARASPTLRSEPRRTRERGGEPWRRLELSRPRSRALHRGRRGLHGAFRTRAHRDHGPRTRQPARRERFDVIVIGAGQAGLSVGYHLAQHGLRFVILDANERDRRLVAQALGLAAPVHAGALRRARRDAVPGAARLVPDQGRDGRLPRGLRRALRAAGAQRRRRSTGCAPRRRRYVVNAGDVELEAEHVVVAMANYQRPRVPAVRARARAREIVQLHSSDYSNPAQLRAGTCCSWAPATRARRSRSSSRTVAGR